MYTLTGNADVEAAMANDVDRIVRELQADGISYDAAYLVGGFGRGEGTVAFDGRRWHAVNDFDIVLIAGQEQPPAARLHELGKRLAVELGVDFVDIGCLPGDALRALRPTLFNYELKHGSRHLGGDQLLEAAPDIRLDDVPAFEFLQLLCNRCAGLNMMVQGRGRGSKHFDRNQLVKAAIAVGDVAVYLAGHYSHRYRERSEWFDKFYPAGAPFELTPAAQKMIRSAYRYKLSGPDTVRLEIEPSDLDAALTAGFVAIARRCAGADVATFRAAERKLWDHYALHRNLFCWIRRRLFASTKPYDAPHPKHVMRTLLSQPWFYLHRRASPARAALEFFRRFWCVPRALRRGWSARTALRLWEERFHPGGL